MTDLDERVLNEARQQGSNLLTEELLALIERHHPHETPGVTRETVGRYADALADTQAYEFDPTAFDDELTKRLTDAETWQGRTALYALDDDRVSVYPARWHDRLGGSTDVREFVRFLLEREAFLADLDSGGAGHGIPEDTLLDVVAVVGRIDREDAKATLERHRAEGELVEDADQHPDARVRPD